MNLKNHKFFQKYKYLKYILLAHLAFSILLLTSTLVHGFTNHDVVGIFKAPYQNYKALNNPEKYLQKVFFVVDTAYIETQISPNRGSAPSHKDYTIIKGNLLNSNIKREITCTYDVLDRIYRTRYNYNTGGIIVKKVKGINVWKSTINDEVFLGNERAMSAEKDNAIGHIYFQVTLIPLLIILFILKRKSEEPEPRIKKPLTN